MRNKKAWLFVVCAMLLLVVSIAGTIAYLTEQTDAVTNTFTIGKLLDDSADFVLKEHEATDPEDDGVYKLDTAKEVSKNEYTVLPGVNLPKDPFVRTDEELNLDAYVFIEVVDNTGTDLTVTVDINNWTDLSKTGPKGGKVYVMKANNGIVEAGKKLEEITILKDNTVVVAQKDITDAEEQFGGDVSFYGYMIQVGTFTSAGAAWDAGFGGTAAD